MHTSVYKDSRSWHVLQLGRQAMGETARIQVLLPTDDAERFDAYCHEKGHKKSTLIARLVREHLAREGFAVQTVLTLDTPRRGGRRSK